MRLSGGLSLALALVFAGSVPAAVNTPSAEVNGETLVGLWEGVDGGVAAFKGVPFAAAPVGDLRWRAPQQHRPRPGVQEAKVFASACMQGDHITRWYAGVAQAFGADPAGVGRFIGVSEDCLYLNVWTPRLDSAAGLPVFVWVHGGSNAGGWSYEPNYLGDRLAARGVVVVTVAYRVGPFGFFSHPALDNGSGEPVANFGWLDVQAAVAWVRSHITAFGGDPDRVTLAGESSGAANVVDFLLHGGPGAESYRRVIAQSPPLLESRRRSLAEEQAIGLRLAVHLGMAEAASAQELRAIPAADLARAANVVLPGHYYGVVDDGLTFVRDHPGRSRRAGDMEILAGTNADEWLMYLEESTSWDDVDSWLAEHAPGREQPLRKLLSGSGDPRRALDRLQTALNMGCPTQAWAAASSNLGGRAWLYHFTRQRPGPGGELLGAYHGTEIAYVFNQHEYWQAVAQRDHELTEMVMDYWAEFTRTGAPNLPARPEWPAFTADEAAVLELGDVVRKRSAPDRALCRWLETAGGVDE